MSARVCAWLALVIAGCGASALQPQFQGAVVPTPEALVQPMLKPEKRDERPVAVAVTRDPMRLCAWELREGKLLWELPVEALSAPLVVGDAIVMQEREGVTVRDLGSGSVRAIADEEGRLVGADGVRGAVIVSVAYDTPNPRAALIYVAGRSVAWKRLLNLPAGVPALSNDHVLVPWATQRLTVLSAADGGELARFHFKSTVIGHAIVDGERVYVGQNGLLPVTKTLLGSPDTAPPPYTPKKRELPGQPPLLTDGYLPVPEPDSAHHRLTLSWRLADGDTLATENDTLWLRFYRLLFALDAQQDRLRWVRTFDRDLVGLASVPGGVLTADDAGVLRFFDTTGKQLASRSLGKELRVMTLRPGTFVPSADTSLQAAAAGANEKSSGLGAELFTAAALADDRLSAGRAYAIQHLATMPEPIVTAQLIGLCSDRKNPEPVRIAACNQLEKRSNGESDVVESLRRHASFLEGIEHPPVGPLAQAAANMKLTKAGPLLVAHVEDPHTPARELPMAMLALERLGQRSAIPAIARFVRLHHAEPAGSELSPAVIAALHALGALKARNERATLEQISQDGLTTQPVRDAARAALLALTPAKAEPAPVEEPQQEVDEVLTDPRPYALTPEVVRGVLTQLRPSLGRCLAADESKPRSARASIVVDASGQVEGVFVSPSTLTACVEPVLRAAKFPSTRAGRQHITHVFGGPNAKRTIKPKPVKAKPAKTKPSTTKPAKSAGTP